VDVRHLRTVETVIVNGRVQDTGYHAEYRIPIARPAEETAGGYRPPVLTGISPVVATELSATGVKLVVTGSSFVRASLVRFDGTPLPTVYKDPNRLEATVPPTLLTRVGTFNVTVFTPRPDGGESRPQYFIVKFRR
jgi:hypothetical protein